MLFLKTVSRFRIAAEESVRPSASNVSGDDMPGVLRICRSLFNGAGPAETKPETMAQLRANMEEVKSIVQARATGF